MMKDVVQEAMSWIGTPYRHRGNVKGAGADCAMFPLEVYASCGYERATPPENYPVQWHLHFERNWYMEEVMKVADEIDGDPQPGDFVMWKFGLAFGHGGIVVDWPIVIHAHEHAGVILDDANDNKWFWKANDVRRETKFFRPRVAK